jgi:hypothetical protein
MASLLAGWEPVIVLETQDADQVVSLTVQAGRIVEVTSGARDAEHKIFVQAEEEVLRQVFSGLLNPARAHLDGTLAVFGTERDKVKLDAISLILWGI